MTERTLPRDFTAEELDRGEGMVFHPLTGVSFHGYRYESDRHQYLVYAGWAGINLPVGRIGDGRERSAGDPYPDHWRFDPYTVKITVMLHPLKLPSISAASFEKAVGK